MNSELKAMVEAVKKAKATALFCSDVEVYGGESRALRALDCVNREEAINMLSAVQPFSIFKRDGKVVVQ